MKVETIWAGYGPDGNDRRGHVHPHPEGSFIRSDGVRGYYCAAPLDVDLECTDPDPRVVPPTTTTTHHSPTDIITTASPSAIRRQS